MSVIGFVHMFGVGIWLGLVAVESVIELVGRLDVEKERTAAKMHFYTDIFVEVPIILLVLVTGLMLFDADKMEGWYAVKVVCGLAAIFTNLLCVVFVIQRAKAIEHVDAQVLRAHSNKVFITISALPLAGVAFFIGLHLLGLY